MESANVATLRVALIGYGEVGGIFGAALAKAGVGAVSAYDVLIADASWAAKAAARAESDCVALAPTTNAAVANCDLVISAVTAAATSSAAEQIASACRRGAFVLDVNSASPRTKTACAAIIKSAGGRYVEAAVMSSVPPHGIRVPMLLGGPHAEVLQPTLATLGFAATVGSTAYGVVSAIKLCRSVFSDAGIASRMTTATADVQAWVAMLRADGVFASAGADATWRDLADRIERKPDA